MQVSLTPERANELTDLAEYLSSNFPQYSIACRYLLQLAGKVALKRTAPTKLGYILSGPSPGVQRGHAELHDPEPHNIRKLHVKFHRYY